MIIAAPRRAVAVLVAAGLLAGAVTGCSSSKAARTDSSPPTGPAPTSTGTGAAPTSAGSAAPPPTDAATVTAVTTAYAKFFDPKTPEAISIALLQDGPAFEQAVHQQSQGSLAQSSAAKVSKVTLQSPNTAKVVFSILVNGKALLSDQPGYAVRESGTWKVAGQTFCALLTLQGSPPPACSTPAATTLPN